MRDGSSPAVGGRSSETSALSPRIGALNKWRNLAHRAQARAAKIKTASHGDWEAEGDVTILDGCCPSGLSKRVPYDWFHGAKNLLPRKVKMQSRFFAALADFQCIGSHSGDSKHAGVRRSVNLMKSSPPQTMSAIESQIVSLRDHPNRRHGCPHFSQHDSGRSRYMLRGALVQFYQYPNCMRRLRLLRPAEFLIHERRCIPGP